MTETKQFLYLIRPTRAGMVADGPTEQENEVLARHFAYLKDLTDRGVVLLAGRTLTEDETTFGIVVFRADSEPAAERIMREDPAVRESVMSATLYPYRVALLARDWDGGD
jgi:uncharacterized protein YciI